MGRDTASESDSDLSTLSRTKHDINDFSDVNCSEPDNKKIKKKVRSKHKCAFEGCAKVFNRPWRLEAHLKLHNNERPFICDVAECSKAYTNTSHLKRHKQTRHPERVLDKPSIRCTEAGCEATFKTRQFLARHLRRVHAPFPFVCQVVGCGKSFKRNRHLKEHSFVHTGVHPYRCDTCDQRFDRSYNLKRHARGHRTFTCSLGACSETFASGSLYRKHMAVTHKSDYMCQVCDKRFSTAGNRNAHLLRHADASSAGPRWPCPHAGCTAVFAQERYATQHAAHKHDETRRFVCPIADCGKVFFWRRNLLHHNKIEHGAEKMPPKPKKKPRAPRFDKGVPKQSLASVMADIPLTGSGHNLLIEKEDFTTDSELGETIRSEHARDSSHKPHEEDGHRNKLVAVSEKMSCIDDSG